MVWRRSACHASSNCSQIQIASESRVRRLNVARRSKSCIANPIFSVPLLILESPGSWALGAAMAIFSLVSAASARLRCFSAGSFASASISRPEHGNLLGAGDLTLDITSNLGVERLLGLPGFVIGAIE